MSLGACGASGLCANAGVRRAVEEIGPAHSIHTGPVSFFRQAQKPIAQSASAMKSGMERIATGVPIPVDEPT